MQIKSEGCFTSIPATHLLSLILHQNIFLSHSPTHYSSQEVANALIQVATDCMISFYDYVNHFMIMIMINCRKKAQPCSYTNYNYINNA